MIVLNERAWVESMIKSSDLGSAPFYTLSRVCRYYMEMGYSQRESRCMMEAFLRQCDAGASIVLWNDKLRNAENDAKKKPLVNIEHICITQKELDRISELNGKQIKRLAFTLLCIAKYWNIVNPDNNYWVNTKDGDIMKMANIKTSSRKQDDMFRELRDKGFIRFAKRIDSLNTCVTFAEDGDAFLYIDDFRNLGFQYIKACGGDVFECSNCGIVMSSSYKSDWKPRKYCPDCANMIRIRQNVESVMRIRAKSK